MVWYMLAFMFTAGGAIFAWLGYASLAAARKRRVAWVSLQGTVVDFAERSTDKGATLYAPVYQYAMDGRHFSGTSTIASSPPSYTVGDPIALVVNPALPGQSEVSGADIRGFTYGLLLLGAAVAGLGLLLAWLELTGRLTVDQ